MNAALARVFVLIVACAACRGGAAGAAEPTTPPKTRTPATRPSAATRAIQFESFGVALEAPQGLRRIPEGAAGQIARWAVPDSRGGGFDAIVVAEVQPVKGTMRDAVGKLSRSMGGTVEERGTTLGGQDALRVRVPAGAGADRGANLRPAEAVATVRGGYLYVVSGLAEPGADVAPAVEALRASWKWVPIVAPSANLSFRGEAFPLFGGRVTLDVPATMRPYPVNDPKTEVHLGSFNYLRGSQDFFLHIAHIPVDAGVDHDTLARRFQEGLRQKTGGGGGALTFRRDPKAVPPRSTSNLVKMPQPEQPARGAAAAPKQEIWTRWAIVEVSPTDSVLLTITVHDQPPKERDLYARLFDKILATVKTAPAK